MTWQSLTTELAPAIEPLLATRRARLGARALSDFSFANLYLFRAAHQYRWRGGAWPALRGVTYDGTGHVFPLFDLRAAPPGVIADLLTQADCFFPLAEADAAALPPGLFRCEARAQDADYLFPADNFRHYRGAALRKKRAQMNQFLALGAPSRCRLTPADVPQALEVLAAWLASRGKGAHEADAAPCSEALRLLERLGLEGTLYRQCGRAVGFVITEALVPGVRVVRFAKGLDDHPGVYPFMFHDQGMADPGLQWLNFEQDLGLANFRQAKRAYAPWEQLPKYRVRLLGTPDPGP